MSWRFNNGLETLKRDDALALWEEGRDAWNNWVANNLDYNIDFEKVDFSDYGIVNFSGFNFPNGDVDFSYATFGDGDVDFSNATFGDGNVFFSRATFGDGNVSFSEATFGEGQVSFSNATFGEGDVSFYKANFGDGNVYFSHTTFGDGEVSFNNANFGKGDISFYNVKFGGIALFTDLINVQNLKKFSFKHSTFDGPLEISAAYIDKDKTKREVFPCLIDLTNTKTSHHVSLSGVKCALPRGDKSTDQKSYISQFFDWLAYQFFYNVEDWIDKRNIGNADDIARARRLKELAEDNKNHQAAQDFHVLEMQAKRTHTRTYWLNSEFWFEKLSNYGRSVTRPVHGLFYIWIIWAEFYLIASLLEHAEKIEWQKALAFSAANMFAFIPSAKNAIQIDNDLFGSEIPTWIYLLTFSQSGISILLLFLFGLALRHKYRI